VPLPLLFSQYWTVRGVLKRKYMTIGYKRIYFMVSFQLLCVMENVSYVGIDIAKESFVVGYLDATSQKYRSVSYNYSSEACERFLSSLSPSSHCVLEATGNYHLRLVYLLCERDYRVSVVNPLSIKRFVQMRGSISKTDSQDAIHLCKYGQSEHPPIFSLPEPSLEKLKQRRTLLYQFKEQLQRLRNYEEALLHHPKVDDFTLQCVQEEITHLQDRLDKIVQEIRDIIDRDYSDYLDLIKSVPGFGDTTAQAVIEALQSFQGFEQDTKGRAFIKFVGLAPTIFRSGTSVRGRSHINRATGSNLRKILYMPAVSVCTHTKKDNVFKTYYLRLRSVGKSFKEAIVAVMHKMVKVVVAVIKRKTKFDIKVYGKTFAK